MKRPHRPYRAADWHRDNIERQVDPRERLRATVDYLASTLVSLPPDLADEVAAAAAADLAIHAELAMVAATEEACR